MTIKPRMIEPLASIPDELDDCAIDMLPLSDKLAFAVLMFHGGGSWTEKHAGVWLALTGKQTASTKTLCDLARQVLDD